MKNFPPPLQSTDPEYAVCGTGKLTEPASVAGWWEKRNSLERVQNQPLELSWISTELSGLAETVNASQDGANDL